MSASTGVKGVVIINGDGIPVKSTLNDRQQDLMYAALVSDLNMKARQTVRQFDDQDSLLTLRLRSQKHEIIIAPEKDVIVVTVHEPSFS